MHKKIFSEAGYLTGSSIIEKILAFLILPIMTANLSVDKYGSLVTAISYVSFFSLLYYNGLHSSFFRWYSLWEESWDKRIYEKYIFMIIFTLAIGLVIILTIVNLIYPLKILLGIEFKLLIIVYFSNIAMIPYMIKSTIWIVDGKAKYTLIFTLVRNIILFYLTWELIVVWKSEFVRPAMEIISMILLWSYIIYQYIYCYPSCKEVKFNDIKSILKKSFSYGWALQITQITFWIISSSDRILINHFLGSVEVAYFSILMLGLTPIFIIINFNNSFSVYYNKTLSAGISLAAINRYILQYVFLGSGILFLYKLFLFNFSHFCIAMVATAEYYVVEQYMHFTADILMLYMVNLLLSRYFHYKLENSRILYVNISGAIINIIGNVFLIPLVGIKGSLYSLILSYFTMCIFNLNLIKKEQHRECYYLFYGISIVLFIYIIFNLILISTTNFKIK